MKNKYQTAPPPVSSTGKSELLLCNAVWENEEYPILAFYNKNTGEWIDNTGKLVKGVIVKWQKIYNK